MRFDPHRDTGAALRVVAIYSLFALCWIFLSDHVMGLVIHDVALMVKVSKVKGMLFILLTAILLFLLIRRYLRYAGETQQSLQRSEARFRQLVASASLPLCFLEHDGTIAYFNERFAQVFGYTYDDIPTLQDWWLRAYPDEAYRATVVATWDEAVRQARLHRVDIPRNEYLVTSKDGSVRRMEISGSLVGDSLLATFFDVTEQRRAEEQLRTASERYQSLFQAMSGGIATYRSDDGERFFVTGMNPAGEAMVGRPVQDLMDREVRDAFPGVTAMGLLDVFRRVWTTGSAESLPATLYRENGTVHWYENSVFRTSGSEIAAHFADVSSRMAAEEALRQSEVRYRSLFDAMQEGVALHEIICDAAGEPADYRFLEINPAFERITGLTRETVIGRTLREVVP